MVAIICSMHCPVADRRIFLVSESLEFSKILDNNDTGARFSKVPIINGPGKLSVYIKDRVQ